MTPEKRIVGILLAAGRGARFDPAGLHNKLLQSLPDGGPVVVASASNLLAATGEVFAVVRPAADEVLTQLEQCGCRVSVCADAGRGMGRTLAHALRLAPDADGWVIALADMPWVRPQTISALMNAIDAGADIAVPMFEGRRGNPVAFSRAHLRQLLDLDGDQGARQLLMSMPVVEVVLDDPGVVRDIDSPGDLA